MTDRFLPFLRSARFVHSVTLWSLCAFIRSRHYFHLLITLFLFSNVRVRIQLALVCRPSLHVCAVEVAWVLVAYTIR